MEVLSLEFLIQSMPSIIAILSSIGLVGAVINKFKTVKNVLIEKDESIIKAIQEDLKLSEEYKQMMIEILRENSQLKAEIKSIIKQLHNIKE